MFTILKKLLLEKAALLLAAVLIEYAALAQKDVPDEFRFIDTTIFLDASHHWYLYEKERVIQPRVNPPRYKATDLACSG